jgi:hypothetical protein
MKNSSVYCFMIIDLHCGVLYELIVIFLYMENDVLEGTLPLEFSFFI